MQVQIKTESLCCCNLWPIKCGKKILDLYDKTGFNLCMNKVWGPGMFLMAHWVRKIDGNIEQVGDSLILNNDVRLRYTSQTKQYLHFREFVAFSSSSPVTCSSWPRSRSCGVVKLVECKMWTFGPHIKFITAIRCTRFHTLLQIYCTREEFPSNLLSKLNMH